MTTEITTEPRSFAPIRNARMKRDPLPDNPDNAALGRAIVQVEECVHETGKAMGREHAKLRAQVTRMHTRLTRMEKQGAGVRQVVGVGENGEIVRKTPMLMSRLSFFSTIMGCIFGLFLVVQLGNALWPSIHLMGDELWAFIIRQGGGAVAHGGRPGH